VILEIIVEIDKTEGITAFDENGVVACWEAHPRAEAPTARRATD
jgi:hypothetical protein